MSPIPGRILMMELEVMILKGRMALVEISILLLKGEIQFQLLNKSKVIIEGEMIIFVNIQEVDVFLFYIFIFLSHHISSYLILSHLCSL